MSSRSSLQLQSPTFAAEAPGNFTGDNRQNPPHGKKLSPCPQACEAVASEGEGAKGAMAIDALPLALARANTVQKATYSPTHLTGVVETVGATNVLVSVATVQQWPQQRYA
jgi:hypothetical protein